ncbi:MAG: lysylphosphatidylglycerol synthetase, partial [Mesorhizobium amorphae]
MSASTGPAPEEATAADAPSSNGSLFPGWARVQHVALPILGLVVAAIAIVVLDRFLQGVTLAEIRSAAARVPVSDLVLAVLLTALSFAAVACYDTVAVETVTPGRIPKALSAFVGATGYAISNALGFAILTGGALRYRIYAAEGIAFPDIGRIVGTSWLAIWFAFAVMIGLGLILDPADAPIFDQLDPTVDIALGIALLVAVAGFLLWLSGGERQAGWGRFSLRLPSSKGAVLQLVAGVVDVSAAAGVLWVLMPDTMQAGPALFMLVYVIATVVGIASHAPGGIGAFEATVVAGLGLGGDADALAALLIYRLVYTVLPFVVAVIGVLVFEVVGRRSNVSSKLAGAARLFEPLVPPLSAGLTFLGGAVLLVSGVTPGVEDRLSVLADLLPLPFIELSHLAASAVAVAMLVVARGLARRLRTAWLAALLLFGLGALFSLLKGLDWEEALILLVSSGVLLAFRSSFYRKPGARALASLSLGWLASLASLVVFSVWLGFVAYREVGYTDQLWWQFALDGDAPRFLRFATVALLLTAGLGLHTLINRPANPGRSVRATLPDAVPRLVAEAPETTASLALLGDKEFLLSPDGRGFVMYARSG